MKAFGVLGICMIYLAVLATDSKEEKAAAFKKRLEDIMAGKGEGGKFVGSNQCRACHTTPKTGAQFKIWLGTAHSKAYHSLLSEEGKKRAAAKNVAKPEEDTNCLQCHTPIATAPKEFVDEKYDKTEGVGCEACHGPGEKHVQLQRQAMKENTKIPEGLTVLLKARDPDNKRALCERCHKKHEWHEMEEHDNVKAWEKIAHPKPKG
jgi:hypothetical protein